MNKYTYSCYRDRTPCGASIAKNTARKITMDIHAEYLIKGIYVNFSKNVVYGSFVVTDDVMGQCHVLPLLVHFLEISNCAKMALTKLFKLFK